MYLKKKNKKCDVSLNKTYKLCFRFWKKTVTKNNYTLKTCFSYISKSINSFSKNKVFVGFVLNIHTHFQ